MRVVGSCNDSRTVIFLSTYVFTLACMHVFSVRETYLHLKKNKKNNNSKKIIKI